MQAQRSVGQSPGGGKLRTHCVGPKPSASAAPRLGGRALAPAPLSPDSKAATSCSARLQPGCWSGSSRAHSHVTYSSMAASPSLEGLVPVGEGNILDKIRAFLFFAWSLTWAVPLFISMMVMAPFVLAFDKYKRLAQHFVNNIWAKISTSIFYPVEVIGHENLPPSDKPVVYVANHQSFLDIFSLFHLNRPFKFISKASIFYIPIVGWSMFMTGHVMLHRMDRRSQLDCLKQCRELLGKGASVLFFPEGTRSKDCVMTGFKKGAFSVAAKAGVDIVPMTILGSGALMPSGKESQLRTGGVRIIVHKPIPTKKRDADQVCKEARTVIASALPLQLQGDANKMTADE